LKKLKIHFVTKVWIMCDNICRATESSRQTASTNRALRYITRREEYLDCDESRTCEAVGELEVTGEGTKLMKSLQLDTVLIRLRSGDLKHSTVYHALLELQFVRHTMRFIAILFSDPSSPGRTQFAELLPLSVEFDCKGRFYIVPTLSRATYKKLFYPGCLVKVLAIGSGRSINSSETLPWKQWKPRLSARRSIITDILAKDILEMPASMINRASDKKAIHTSIQGYSSSFSSSRAGLYQNNYCQDTPKYDLSEYYPSLRFPGIKASGGSSFAKWFKLVPPAVRVDTNFKCDRGTTLRKDRFSDSEAILKYLSLKQVD